MELLIRSQNKELLIKFENIKISEITEDVELHTDKYHIGDWLVECDKYILGCYKTKERALKVLDEIQSLFGPFSSIQMPYSKESLKLQELSTYVYKMPEE